MKITFLWIGRTRDRLWAPAVDEYLDRLEALLWPDLVIVGGGVSSKFEKWGPFLTSRVPVTPATLGNDAGIVGAALAAVALGI